MHASTCLEYHAHTAPFVRKTWMRIRSLLHVSPTYRKFGFLQRWFDKISKSHSTGTFSVRSSHFLPLFPSIHHFCSFPTHTNSSYALCYFLSLKDLSQKLALLAPKDDYRMRSIISVSALQCFSHSYNSCVRTGTYAVCHDSIVGPTIEEIQACPCSDAFSAHARNT